MTAEDLKRLNDALENFSTCAKAGSKLFIEVKEGTKYFLGWCAHAGRRIDVEPTCRICIRWTTEKPKPSKKTATQIDRIKRGRLRQQQRKKERENRKFRRPGLDHF